MSSKATKIRGETELRSNIKILTQMLKRRSGVEDEAKMKVDHSLGDGVAGVTQNLEIVHN